MVLLNIQKLSQTLGKKNILKEISITVSRGQIVALLGPNGAGKTTLLRTIIGLTSTPPPIADLNRIIFNDQVINTWPIYKRVENGLVYLPQHTSLLQQLTVQENLSLIYEYQPYWKKKAQEEFEKERDQWLEQTQLTITLTQKASTLSGGQKRKLEIIRALLMHPTCIMLDEPFAGVDPKSIYELKKIFIDIAAAGIAIIISDHNVEQLLSIAQAVYVVINGVVITSGSIKEVIENNFTKESYLGPQFYQEITSKYGAGVPEKNKDYNKKGDMP